MTILLTAFLAFQAIAQESPDASDRAWKAAFGQYKELRLQGNYVEAKTLAYQALSAAEAFGAADVRLGMALTEAGSIECLLGRLDEAEKLLTRAIRILEPDPDQGLTLAAALNELSTVYVEFGSRYAKAEKMQRRALELIVSTRGSSHPDVALCLNTLATIRIKRGNKLDARLYFEKALRSKPDSLAMASILSNLGHLCYEQKDFASAVLYLQKAIQQIEGNLGAEHALLIAPLYDLGLVYVKTARGHQAELPFRRALAISDARFGPGHSKVAPILFGLANLRRQAGDKKQARELERQAKTIQNQTGDRTIADALIDVSDMDRNGGKVRF